MRIVTAISGKGGVGKTTTVANLGVALSRMGKRVLLIDGNFVNPDLRLHFGLAGFPVSLQEALLHGTGLKEASVSRHGVDLVPAVSGSPKSLDTLPGLLADLRGYDTVLIDTFPGLEGGNRLLLEQSDGALLVSNPDLVTWTDSKRIGSQVNIPTLWVQNRVVNGRGGDGFRVSLWAEMEVSLRKGVPLAALQREGPAASTYADLARRVLALPLRSKPPAPPARAPVPNRLRAALLRFRHERLKIFPSDSR